MGVACVNDYKALPPKESFATTAAYENARKQTHLKAATRMLHTFQENGGVYIKAGQHIAALVYLLPDEWTNTMRVLQDCNPSRPFEPIRQLVETELGRPLGDIFEDFSVEPIAAASLAQVHTARLRATGELVAVKVQYPGLREASVADLWTIETLIDFVCWAAPEFQMKWLADEFRRNLPRELNFKYEAENCEKSGRFYAYPQSGVRVPRVCWDLTTERVLVMEFMEGCKVNDKEKILAYGLRPNQVAKQLSKLYSEQIFIHGFVHCDPHPGNILVRPRAVKQSWFKSLFFSQKVEPELVLLDHGLYRQLDDDLRIGYCEFWKSLLLGSESELLASADVLLRAGEAAQLLDEIVAARKDRDKQIGPTLSTANTPLAQSTAVKDAQKDADAVLKDQDRLLRAKIFVGIVTARPFETATDTKSSNMSEQELEIMRDSIQIYASLITTLLETMPRPLLLLFKTNDLLRSVNIELGAPINGFAEVMALDCLRGLRFSAEQDAFIYPSIWAQISDYFRSLFLRWSFFFYALSQN
eukprot:TRINITY_DN7603_c0_g1_i1.p1 TRINITY_DN7603_c0_g1~~TRINITY_DN7603_c0_g1_i1.p1  ORF type:complete len:583 (+),score=125.05 TRINITY_DN7603_c0_g1_i1:164-1750(+)